MSDPYAREEQMVRLGDRDVRVPYASADRWISCVTASPVTILTGLTDGPTAEAVVWSVVDGDVSPEQVSATAYQLLERVVPYRWWKTVRLLGLSTRDDIVGHLTLSGLDPRDLTVAQWCAAVYTLVTRNADTKERFKVDVEFDAPPPGIVENDWISDDEFKAMVESARAMPGQK